MFARNVQQSVLLARARYVSDNAIHIISWNDIVVFGNTSILTQDSAVENLYSNIRNKYPLQMGL